MFFDYSNLYDCFVALFYLFSALAIAYCIVIYFTK